MRLYFLLYGSFFALSARFFVQVSGHILYIGIVRLRWSRAGRSLRRRRPATRPSAGCNPPFPAPFTSPLLPNRDTIFYCTHCRGLRFADGGATCTSTASCSPPLGAAANCRQRKALSKNRQKNARCGWRRTAGIAPRCRTIVNRVRRPAVASLRRPRPALPLPCLSRYAIFSCIFRRA